MRDGLTPQTPSKATARMTRTTLKYVATAHGTDDWHLIQALPLDHAMVLLDAAMASQDLVSQSRSNYRGYLRRLYRFMDQKGIHAAPDGETRMWPCMPVNETGMEKRAQLAYQKFVKWAICAGVWPHTVKPSDILAWALSGKGQFEQALAARIPQADSCVGSIGLDMPAQVIRVSIAAATPKMQNSLCHSTSGQHISESNGKRCASWHQMFFARARCVRGET